MTRGGKAAAGLALAAAAYLAQGKRDRALIEADPAWAELRRSTAPNVVCLDGWSDEKLVVDTYGPEEARVVLLVHGWTCTARFWARQIRALREDHRVIAYDMRGHGRSGTPAAGDYSIEALAGDLDRVVRACVPEGRGFVLAGHSLGAMTAIAWAREHPESAQRLGAVALINTGIGELIAEARIAPLPRRLTAVQALIGKAALTSGRRVRGDAGPLSHRAVRHVALNPAASPGEVAFCEEMILNCPAPARAGCGKTLAGLDLWWSLHALEAPAVVVVGERDRLTPPAHGRRIAAQLATPLGVVELEGCGHMGPVEAGGRVSDLLRGLARSYASAGSGQESEAEPNERKDPGGLGGERHAARL